MKTTSSPAFFDLWNSRSMEFRGFVCWGTLTLALLITASAKAESCDLTDIDGYLIDLDGTIYEPEGLINGALEFYSWLKASGKPHVFLSNSAKGWRGVQSKLYSEKYRIDTEPVPKGNIMTAGMLLAKSLISTLPHGAKVYLLQSAQEFQLPSGEKYEDSFLQTLLEIHPKAMDLWDIRTNLTDSEAKEWARTAKSSPGRVFVVYGADGDIVDRKAEGAYNGWTYEIMRRAGWLIANGAGYFSTARDTHSGYFDADYTDLDLSTPGPGAFLEFFHESTYPNGPFYSSAGKGGDLFKEYSWPAVSELLESQGASRTTSRKAFVGDTLNTDIAAARQVSGKGVFVLSGFHQMKDLPYYPEDVPACILDDVSDIPKHVGPSDATELGLRFQEFVE